jgi:hypothetical protein
MPLIVTFRGRRVKRRWRVGERLMLKFYGEKAGEVGKLLLVTQNQWREHSQTEFVRERQPVVEPK